MVERQYKFGRVGSLQTVLVTGAASGIGEAVARQLVARGDRVGLMDTDAAGLRRVAADLGKKAVVAAGSVAATEDCAAAVDLTIGTFGRLDAVSHNAGIQRYGTAEDTPAETWNEVIAVNLTGGFNIAKAALPELRKHKGSLAFMGSVQSLATQQNVAAYTAAKHGLLGLTRSIAMDFAADGVRANLVAPGAVKTPMLDWAVSLSDDQDGLWKVLNAMHPLGRTATADDVASVVAFLLSDAAAFVTGEVIRVDGGLLTQIAGTPKPVD